MGGRETWNLIRSDIYFSEYTTQFGAILLRYNPKTTQALNLSLQQSYCSFKKKVYKVF